MLDFDIICRYCGSSDVKMNGRAIKNGYDRQMYFCHNGAVFRTVTKRD